MKLAGAGIAAALAGAAIGASVAVYAAGGRSVAMDRAGVEALVRGYILEHPEIIPEAMARLQARDTAKAIAASRKALETPFAGAWAGNPSGDVVLVEFFDYACGFCRAALPDVDRLLAEDKGLKLVFRELPILSDESDKAARVSLAAAKQGRFLAFHRALYQAGALDEAKLTRVSSTVGLSLPRVAADLAGADLGREIEDNIALARSLKLTGTPSFVVGDQALSGAVGYDALKQAIADARAKRG